MAEVGVAFVSIVPSAKGFGSALNQQVGSASTTAGATGGKKAGSSFVGGFKGAVGPALAVVAGAGIIKGLKGAIAEAREAQKVGAVTAQIIKQTGGAANVTAKDIAGLTTAISNNAGVDDELIQKGANLLLTFKNVRNEVGAGNAIFNQATSAAVDLAATGYGSVTSNAKLLGKALNDPVKGMSALKRAGVDLTKDQQKQVKAFVKSGDILGAQKIILKEIQSQVGGTARASATAGEKMKVAWDNAKESLGTALLPAIDKLQIAITTKIIPAIVSFIGFLQKNPAIVKAFAIGIAAIAAAFVIAFVAANAIVIGIGLLVAALVYAYTQSETFRAIVDFVFKAIKTIIVGVIKFIVTVIKNGITIVKGIWAGIKAIVGFVKSAFNTVKSWISTAMDFVKTRVSNSIKNIVTFFKELPGKVINAVKSLASKLKNFAKDAMTGLWNGLKEGAQKVYDKAREIANKVASTIKNALKVFSPSKVMIEVGKNVTKGLEIGIASGGAGIEQTMHNLAGTVVGSTPGIGARFSSTNLAQPGAFAGGMDVSLVGARVEMGKDGFGTFVDGRIRINDRQGALQARYA